jgi:ATP-binding cassette, subfamily B, bacterial
MNVSIQRYWALLVTYLRPQWGRFLTLAALLLGGIGLQILLPQITRTVIDQSTSGALNDQLTAAAVGFILVAIVQQVVALATTYFGQDVAWTATNALRSDLARHCLDLDMTFHTEHAVGEMIDRLEVDVTDLANFFSSLVIVVIGNLLLVVGILVVLAVQDWRMGIAFAIFAALALLSLGSIRNIAIPFERAFRNANALLFGFLEERLAATEDIRSSGATQTMINGLYDHHREILRYWQPNVVRQWAIQAVYGSVVAIGYCVAMVSGHTLFQMGTISIGTAYLIFNYAALLNRPFTELSAQLDQMQSIGASVDRVEELFNMQPTITDGPGVETLPDGALALDFDRVEFAYHAGENVLTDLDFHLQPGQILGLLGRTGSGKTTISRLILRLYDADGGTIRLGGEDICRFTLAELRRAATVVTQDVQLFEANVRDNLTFFDRSISDEQILDVLTMLGLSDWLAGLPNGLDSRLETGGRNLSAGEAQLVAFARAFLRNPRLIILDEASARLDPATEQRIEQALDHLLQGRTAIIIAHRLRTVQRADQILILEDGQMAEYGEREKLASDPQSRFYHLLQVGLEEVLA